MDLIKLSHDEIVEAAAEWLSSPGRPKCQIILKEFHCAANIVPDVIGFKCGPSVQIEAKATRSDFIKDTQKHHRKHPERDVGNRRYYACPDGLIEPDELPEKWGLLYVSSSLDVDMIVEADPVSSNLSKERLILYSVLRREGTEIDIEWMH